MSKQKSDHDKYISKKKGRANSKLRWIEERTRQAVHYYSAQKMQDLKIAKQKYLDKIIYSKDQIEIPEIPQVKPKRKRISKKHKRATVNERKSSRVTSKKSMSELQYSDFDDNQHESLQYKQQSESSDSLSSVGKYKLKKIHQCILQFQKAVDSYIDFQYLNRKKMSLSKIQLITYLKTTKYGLNCQKFLQYLQFYNVALYQKQQDRYICKVFPFQEIERRFQQTKELMTRKSLQELDILPN